MLVEQTADPYASSPHLRNPQSPDPRLLDFEDEKVILAVGLGEIVTRDLAEAGALDFGTYDGLIEAVVGAVAVFVDDAEAGTGLERLSLIHI